VTFHCVSRVVDRAMKFGALEKQVFIKMMRQYEAFCGLEVLSYCVMSNHFHILVRVPKKSDALPGEEINDKEFERRLRIMYSPFTVKSVMETLKKCRKNNAVKAARELKKQYTYRMGDISEFMKSLKQKYTRWYNKTNGRSGTLWEQRYSATMIGAGHSTRMLAAYIDLNPLRAGMVKDPANYLYSSYGEALGKSTDSEKNRASEMLMEVMQSREQGASMGSKSPETKQEALQQYRMVLAEEGAATKDSDALHQGQSKAKRRKKSKGFSTAQAEKIIEQGGKLTTAQMLRCKTRYFTAGFAVGSEMFVSNVLESLKQEGRMFEHRKTSYAKLKHVEQPKLRSLRKLVKNTMN